MTERLNIRRMQVLEGKNGPPTFDPLKEIGMKRMHDFLAQVEEKRGKDWRTYFARMRSLKIIDPSLSVKPLTKDEIFSIEQQLGQMNNENLWKALASYGAAAIIAFPGQLRTFSSSSLRSGVTIRLAARRRDHNW